MWEWIVGYLSTTVIGALCLGAAGAALWYKLPTYLPLIGNGVVWGLVVTGMFLIGYGQGWDGRDQEAKRQRLVDQAEALKQGFDRLKSNIETSLVLQENTRVFVKAMQDAAAQRKGDTDDLLQKLMQVPVSRECAWTDDERRRLRNTSIGNAATRGRTNPPAR